MRCISDYIFVSYLESTVRKHVLPGGTELIIPDKYESRDTYGFYTGLRTENLDRKEANPQICYVLSANPKYPQYQPGCKLFLHYLEYDNEETTVGEVTGKMIKGNSVFFRIGDNDEMIPIPGCYVGKRVQGNRFTPNGLMLPEWVQNFRKSQIELTHVPDSSPYQVGEVVITIDDNQYDFMYDRVRYVKVYDHEIVGVLENA